MAKSGNKFKIYLVTSGTPDTNTAIGGELNSQLTVNGTIIDVSDKDSEWKAKIVGQKDWSASGSFNLSDTTTSQQTALFTALVAGTPVTVFIGEIGTGRVYGYLGSALVESIAISGDKDGVVTKDISFQGTGALTQTTEGTTTTTTAG